MCEKTNPKIRFTFFQKRVDTFAAFGIVKAGDEAIAFQGHWTAQHRAPPLRRLDPRQRKGLELFRESNTITSRDTASLFGISERAARNLLTALVDDGFIVIADPAKKSRKYGLATDFQAIL